MFALLAWCVAASLMAQQTKELYILHTSDTHSRLEPVEADAADENAGRGGAVRRATFIRQFRAEHPNTLVFDCGDFSQGTPYYNFYQGEIEVKMMNLMGYDAMTIGNHEFDFGMENMARLFRLAQFPVVCANYGVEGTPLEGLVKPYVVIERDGLRIGVFGLAPRMEGLVQGSKCEGVEYRDPVRTAQETANLLREEERCDVVVCLSHLGIRGLMPDDACDETLAVNTSGIDLILGGHSHTFMEKPQVFRNAAGSDVPVFHTGKNGVYVGVWTLTLMKQ